MSPLPAPPRSWRAEVTAWPAPQDPAVTLPSSRDCTCRHSLEFFTVDLFFSTIYLFIQRLLISVQPRGCLLCILGPVLWYLLHHSDWSSFGHWVLCQLLLRPSHASWLLPTFHTRTGNSSRKEAKDSPVVSLLANRVLPGSWAEV